jgi:hypothetical protein
MSLKIFHFVFIVLSMLLFAGCSVWSYYYGVSTALTWTCGALAIVMAIYGGCFVRKARKIIV